MFKKIEINKLFCINENAPTNNSGNGQVAGLGVGGQGEPGVDKKKKKKSFIEFIKRDK